MRELDIKTRGLYIAIACDIERMMDEIIALCEIEDEKDRLVFKKDKIMHVEMGKKLSRCQLALEAYNPDHLATYSREFEIINDLVTYRNVMAHGYSEFDAEERDDRYITYYNHEKGKIAKYVIEPREFIKNLLVFQNSLLRLVDLLQLLTSERRNQLG